MKAKMAMEGRKRRGGGKERCARGTVQLGRRSYPDSEPAEEGPAIISPARHTVQDLRTGPVVASLL
jgi:hypothetical protein